MTNEKTYQLVYLSKLKGYQLKYGFIDVDKKPTYVKSTYHGDFTLENILHTKSGFCMIDPVTIEYDSYIFDIAKLRQDLKCKWFVRNESNIYMNSKLAIIDHELSKFEYNDDYLLILMLLRILPYTKNNEDKNYLINEINNLWK